MTDIVGFQGGVVARSSRISTIELLRLFWTAQIVLESKLLKAADSAAKRQKSGRTV
jgi:hypothetical protein